MDKEELKNLYFDSSGRPNTKRLKKDGITFSGIDCRLSYPEQIYLFLNDLKEAPLCPCGSKVRFDSINKGYKKTCPKCSLRLRMDTLNKTNLLLYGGNPFQNSGIKEKSKATFISKYGVDNPAKNKDIKEKVLNTNEKRYGTKYPLLREGMRRTPHPMNFLHVKDREEFREKFIQSNGRLNPKRLKEAEYNIPHDFLSDLPLVERAYLYSKELNDVPKCSCGLGNLAFVSFTKGYRRLCKKCFIKKGVEKRTEANINRYGVSQISKLEETKRKARETCELRYGSPSPSMNEEIRDKSRKTFLSRYGVDNPAKSSCVQKKIKETQQSRYPEGHSSRTKKSTEAMKKTSFERYGSEFYISSFDRISKLKQDTYDKKKSTLFDTHDFLFSVDEYVKNKDEKFRFLFRCKKHGIEFKGHFKNGNVPKCPKCFSNRRSSAEIELCETLRNSGIFIETNVNDIIENRELDIYIPSIKTGIEFNGVYWHSKKSKKYHLNKTLACEKKGIRLIHVFEDEWLRDKQLATRRLMYEIGIYQNEEFAHEYHVIKEEGRFILSRGNETPISILFDGESIEFSYGDYLTHVIGGEERLLREYMRCTQPAKIIYKADRSRNGGEHLKQFGFVLLERTLPNYFYVNSRTWERIYPESNSNYVDCIENGYFKLWDCGQNVYEWKRED